MERLTALLCLCLSFRRSVLLLLFCSLCGSVSRAALGEDACTGRYYPAPNPNLPHQPILSAVVLELLFCALVVVVAVFVMNKNMDEPHSYAGLAIGSAYAASIRATSSVSGGFLNPAAATGLSFASIINDGAPDRPGSVCVSAHSA